jgi:hypothetical protein
MERISPRREPRWNAGRRAGSDEPVAASTDAEAGQNAFRRSASLCSGHEGKTKQMLSAFAGEKIDSVDLNTSRENAARERERFARAKLSPRPSGERSARVSVTGEGDQTVQNH